MTIPAGLAAELALLTQALDLPGTDVAETLDRLVADAQRAVSSYLGLSVVVDVGGTRFEFTVLNELVEPAEIRTSLLVPLSPAGNARPDGAISLALILYAARPGAFTDLAADLCWITGRSPAELRLDEHRTLPASHAGAAPLRAMSTVNQAIGVLIARGWTPESAAHELRARAGRAGLDLAGAATLVLAGLGAEPPEPG